MAKLVCRTGPSAGREYPLSKEVVVFGRQSTCDIQVVDNLASRAHAQIRRDGHLFTLVDLGSRNGTQLNGRKVGERSMSFGDRVRIGECEYVLVKEAGDKDLADLLTKYEIQERIGEGGMGIVYRAVQRSMARTIALKVLAPKYAAKPKFVGQFVREARAAGTLNHPNIIQVHDVGEENGLHFFSMEYVDGPTCMQVLREQGPMAPGDALEVTKQVAKALEYAHGQRLIHQDIKPDNIMINGQGQVKLADLGISKTFDEAEAESAPKRVMGTPHYMAPEAALGKKIDHRVDLYSLGTTLYHLLTGKTPYAGTSATEVLKMQVMDPFPAIRDINPAVPEQVCALVERMAAKAPEDRYQTAAEVIEEIRRLESGLGLQAERIAGGDSMVLRRYAAERLPGDGVNRTPTSGNAVAATPPARPRWVLPAVVGGVAAAAVVAVAVLWPSDPAAGDDTGPVPTGQPASAAATIQSTPVATTPTIDPQAEALTRIEAGLRQRQPDLAALQREHAAIGQPSPALRARYDKVAAEIASRLKAAQQAQAAQAVEDLSVEVNRLTEARNYPLALQRIEAALRGTTGPTRTQLTELKNKIEDERDKFIASIQLKFESYRKIKDEARLRELREKLPESLLGSDLEKEIAAAIQVLADARDAALAEHVRKTGALLVRWDLPGVESMVRQAPAGMAGSPSQAGLNEIAAAGIAFKAMQTRAEKLLRGGPIRMKGTIKSFENPDLTEIDAKSISLRPDRGGMVQFTWDKLTETELRILVTPILGEAATRELDPHIAVLHRHAAAAAAK
jgi:hypothetical protein